MSRTVVDASFLLAWALQEDSGIGFDAVLDNLMHRGGVMPAICALEITNVLYGMWRNQRLDEASVKAVLADIRQLPLAVDPRTHERAWIHTYGLAVKHGLTTYDAAYLDLALREGGPFLTLDKALLKAANDEGLLVLPHP